MVIKEPICFGCKHLLLWPVCKAFQGEIPDEIRQGHVDHREPFPGDNGQQFEPTEEAEKA